MIVVGEASGDALGAELVDALRKKLPSATFYGTPGPKMRASGVDSIYDSDTWSVVGIARVLRTIPRFLRIKSRLLGMANARRPDTVILVDFPEFNLKLAKSLKKHGHRIVYYVSPQVWAWRKYRIRTIRESVDLLLSILPFESEWYSKQGVRHVEYVGNPVATRTKPKTNREEFRARLGIGASEQLVALLPGSREKEIARHLPVMLESIELLQKSFPSARFAVAAADERSAELVSKLIGIVGGPPVSLVVGESNDLLNAADAAAISSGTATLEAGVLHTPMAVVYKVPTLDFHLFRNLVDAPHFALINLIAGRRIVTELIQHEFTPKRLSDEVGRLLASDANERMRADLKAATESLSEMSPSESAADAILALVKNESVKPRASE